MNPQIYEDDHLDDGFGNQWRKCGKADCDLKIVRLGKVQCVKCDNANNIPPPQEAR